MSELIDAEKVEAIFKDCLFQEEEDKTNFVGVEGIQANIGFHPQRLDGHKDEIFQMLMGLPETFRQSNGGGWSFLNACNDREGAQWTSLHQRMDQLMTLGIGIGKVKIMLPREMWTAFPGGMPYFAVLDSEEHNHV